MPAAASRSAGAPASSSSCTARARPPSPGTVWPEMVRSPVVNTSARTHRGSGSSTGAGPAQENCRIESAGNTATGRGSALIAAAAAAQPGGYRTARHLAPRPPREVGQHHQDGGAGHRSDRGRAPAPHRDDAAGGGQRVPGHGHCHPLLAVAQHPEAGHRLDHRRSTARPGSGGHQRRQDDGRHCQYQQRPRSAAPGHRRQPDRHHGQQDRGRRPPRKALTANRVRPRRSRCHPARPGVPSVPSPGSARAANAAKPGSPDDW